MNMYLVRPITSVDPPNMLTKSQGKKKYILPAIVKKELFFLFLQIRSMSQQDMMRPKSAMFYVDKTEQVAVDCLDHVEMRLDANGEFPGKDKFSYHF